MGWASGYYFTKKDEKALGDFLKAQGLDENQMVSVATYVQERTVSRLNFWGAISAGVGAGFMGLFFYLGVKYGISQCSCVLL